MVLSECPSVEPPTVKGTLRAALFPDVGGGDAKLDARELL